MEATTAPPQQTAITPENPGGKIDFDYFLDCVHCGLCTSSCPTYLVTGNENDSPRGRIYLMRAVTEERLELNAETRRHLELCLDCRGCETACPSGVQYGKLIEPFRVAMEQSSAGTAQATKSSDWFHRYVLFALFPRPDRLRWALWPARIAQWFGLLRLFEWSGLWKILPQRLGRLSTLLPTLEKTLPPLPEFLPAKGRRRARVALFTGCVADTLFRSVHWATARVLQENGCDVLVPPQQACCGAIHYHAGSDAPAQALADQNVAAFNPEHYDAILVNVAGCGAMLKDYGHHWHDERQAARETFAHKVRDVQEFLDELGLIPPRGSLPLVATYHDACHLAHAQKVREQPRRLLQQIPDLKLVELVESDLCCGAAGTYNLTEPAMADQLAQRKLRRIQATGASVVVTANAGCCLQIQREARLQGEPIRVVHPMELLDESYRAGESVL
jgi:glycolate oxidase iron-sulfur subunit